MSASSSSNASDRHIEALSSGLLNLVNSGRIVPPIRASELLTHLIAATPRTPGARPAFRLTDQLVLEASLRTLARHWEHGTIFLQQSQTGDLVLVDVQLGSTTHPVEKKRKRTVDDDADSAAGSDAEAESPQSAEDDMLNAHGDIAPRLGQLSVELKEVYALLQRGTAKGKLLAEEVRLTTLLGWHYL
jgi:mRNA m6A methyltransferase catalytic subunit